MPANLALLVLDPTRPILKMALRATVESVRELAQCVQYRQLRMGGGKEGQGQRDSPANDWFTIVKLVRIRRG